jgi:L-fuculose-phosphate aldolase
MNEVQPSLQLRRLVVDACHILFNEGQEHFHLGHVSAREPGSRVLCVKPSGIGLGEVEVDDLALMNLDGSKLAGRRSLHHEMPIHTEIYRRRPDVNCVVHTHPFYAAAFSAAAAELQMVSQDSVLFAGGIGRYDSAVLVVTRDQGQRLAQALGDRRVVVLRNHGIAVAGPTVQDATFHAISFDRSLRMQHAAAQLGPIDPIPPDQVRAMVEYFDRSYQGRIEVTFQYLLRMARRG